MKLTHKLSITIACSVTMIVGVYAFSEVRRETTLFESNLVRDSTVLGTATARATAHIWERDGERSVVDFVDSMGTGGPSGPGMVVRWVWLDGTAGDANAPELPVEKLRPVTTGQQMSLLWPPPGDSSEAMYTYIPVSLPETRRAAIEVRQSLSSQRAYIRETILRASIELVALLLLSALSVLALAKLMLERPMRKLIDHTRRIAAGNLTDRIVVSRDELGELTVEMNTMTERLALARDDVDRATAAKVAAVEHLHRAERLTTVGKLAAGMAHEIGTPLNVITGHAQLVTEEYPAGSSAHDNSVIVAEQAHRVAGIVRQLLDFARSRAPVQVSQDLVPVAQRVGSLMKAVAEKRDVILEVIGTPGGLRGRVDAGQLEQVLTNLVMNAIHATRGRGTITVGLERCHAQPPADLGREPGDHACIFVKDEGSGIRPDVLPRIFEPFFTTKDTGEGTGLGLSVVHGIVKQHGGWIEVSTELGTGTCFSVYLPLATEP